MQRPDALILPRSSGWRLIAGWPLIRPSLGTVLFLVLFAAYLAAGAVLVFGHHSIVGDAWSRVANAYYVLYSRDPHLAAIGFVWNPLPSLLVLPLLPLKSVWPALLAEGFAANIISAAFMAGTAIQLFAMLREQRLPVVAGAALTLAFAANPMVVLYGANGMSEAPFLFFLAMATRHLVRWTAGADVGALAYTGVALALAYLTRYEAVAAVAIAGLTVAGVSAARARPGQRGWTALSDMLIVVLPAVFTFAAWAAVSWIIAGSPFETLTSMYGNSAQVARAAGGISAATGVTLTERLDYSGAQLAALVPSTMAIVVGLSAAAAVARRDPRILAPVAMFGGVVVFALAAFVSGSSFGWLRFYISAIPLAAFMAGIGLAAALRGPVAKNAWARKTLRVAPHVGALLILAAFAVGVPATLSGMVDERLGRGETQGQLATLVGADGGPYSDDPYQLAGEVAGYIDALDLPEGAVLADAANAFPILLRSGDPHQFVITPDRDFAQILSDPYRFGVRYVLIPRGGAAGDAVARGLPGITRSDIADLAVEFERGRFGWQLYRLLG